MTSTLRKLALSAFFSAATLSAVTMTSCNKDPETCDAGFEGTDCKTEVRAKFLGTWTASDKTGSSTLVYSVPVSSGSTPTSIIIGNKFSDDFFDNNINATVSGTTFSIPEQNPDGALGYKVKGDGSITNGKITINYTLIQPGTGTTQNYIGTWSK